jgi:hydrogenase large subunit
MTRRVVGPFNRVEGDLEIKLDIDGGAVRAAFINSPLFRGFEQILVGKSPSDALVYTPRICGICSVSQSMAAATARGDQGVAVPDNGAGAEPGDGRRKPPITDAFLLFFMPDFARAVYRAEPWFGAAEARFKAVSGTAAREVLRRVPSFCI